MHESSHVGMEPNELVLCTIYVGGKGLTSAFSPPMLGAEGMHSGFIHDFTHPS